MTLLRLSNQPVEYSWGSHTLLSDVLGYPASGRPMAEVWFGTHEGSPTQVVDEINGSLRERIGLELPFLVKFLAAESPLSIQAHPNRARAREKFLEESANGLPLSSPDRNYRDDNHKPELLVAITDFRALVGFRPMTECLEELASLQRGLASLADLSLALEGSGFRGAMEWIFSETGGRSTMSSGSLNPSQAISRERAQLVETLAHKYPGDPGQLVALLMNLESIKPGDAVFVPAGCIHAYLEGLGVEVMAASDNVLRGGLTPKRVDVRELMAVLDFSESADPVLEPKQLANGVFGYPVPVSDFSCTRLEPDGTRTMAELRLNSEAIVVCSAGQVELSTSLGEATSLRRGESVFVAEDSRHISLFGSGTAFLVTRGVG